MARVYKKLFFEINVDIPTIWGIRTPFFKTKIAEMCYVYRRTGLLASVSVIIIHTMIIIFTL